MKLAFFVIVCIVGFTASTSQAGPRESKKHFYLRADAGLSITQDAQGSLVDSAPETDTIDFGFDEGFFGQAGIGYRWNRVIRTDLTFSLRSPLNASGIYHDFNGLSGEGWETETTSLQCL